MSKLNALPSLSELSDRAKQEFTDNSVKEDSKQVDSNIVDFNMEVTEESNLDADDEVSVSLLTNDDIISVKHFSMNEMFNEVINPFITAMNKESINSISSDTFGFFNSVDYVPNSIKKEYLQFIDETFFVIKGSERESLVYQLIQKAATMCKGNVFHIPYVIPVKLSILTVPKDESRGIKEDIYKEVEVFALSLTEAEIKYLKFKFIQDIDVVYNKKSTDRFKNSKLKFTINKNELVEAPLARR